jgi:hypothetical protein
MKFARLPREVLEQATRALDIRSWRDVHVCGSGVLRVEKALAGRYPDLRLHANDASLLGCALGWLAAQHPVDIHFTGHLACLEALVSQGDSRDRVAALLVSRAMARYAAGNAFAQSHFAHYEKHLSAYLDEARRDLDDYLEGLHLASFTAGDFRVHARRACDRPAAVVAWLPTVKTSGGHERFLRANVVWHTPPAEPFEAEELPAWIATVAASGVPYWVATDTRLDGVQPSFAFIHGRNKPVYSYTSCAASSLRRRDATSKPFRYRPVDPAKLSAQTKVELVRVDSAHINFLKDKYLAPGLFHSSGDMNVLVHLDGALAGGFILSRSSLGDVHEIYVRSDFSIVRQGRLAKLIAMLTTSREAVRAFDRRYFQRTEHLTTTAFTDRPVSMKYRGLFELQARKPGLLQYQSHVREHSPAEIYAEWWRRFAGNAGRAPCPREAEGA